MTSFSELGINPWLIQALNKLSLRSPTEIQQSCIPQILKGRDVVGSAKTGSGKTLAFALPILQHLSKDPYGVFCIVLTPTRELAFQIAEQFRIMGTGMGLKQCIVVGGVDMTQQALDLSKKPHIIIATPGRLVDHIKSSAEAIYFKKVKYLVCDEADRLLHPGFKESMDIITNSIPEQRQNLYFTATLTPDMNKLEFKGIKPFIHQCAEPFDTVTKLDQRYLFIPSHVKDVFLSFILQNKFDLFDEKKENTAIVFTNTCKSCERLKVMFMELGIKCTALHAKMSQNDRLSSIAKFKSAIVPILITTDVGSRGLDIPTVKVVLNFDIPADATDYIHRVGRTARAGRGGIAISFVSEKDVDLIKNIESKINKKLEEYSDIEENLVLETLNKVSLARKVAIMHLMDSGFGEKDRINKQKAGLTKKRKRISNKN